MKSFLVFVVMVALSSIAWSDVVKMKSGHAIDCVVLQENTDSIIIRRGYGTMLLPREAIDSVSKAPILDDSIVPTTQPTPGQRLPGWSDVISSLVKQHWAVNVQPIPATVIDVGVMKHVPYQSYRCNDDYEINIYGDPDHPAGIEIGIYHSLLNSPDAKRNCVEFISSVLRDRTDSALVRVMDRTKDLITRDDLTTEITPSTDPDAYGGWWVSVYSEKDLDAARATDAELKQITVARDLRTMPQPAPPPAATIAAVRPIHTKTASLPDITPVPDPLDDWTPSDIRHSRAPSSGSGGDVYVRGYYRSNGTYVHSYTRSAPRR